MVYRYYQCIYIADIKKLSYNKVPVPEGAEEDSITKGRNLHFDLHYFRNVKYIKRCCKTYMVKDKMSD